jgi:hypothetical protein
VIGALRRLWPLLLVLALALTAWLLLGQRVNDLDRLWTERRTRNGTEVERWRADLRYLQRAMERQHPDLYHSTSRQAFTEGVRDLEAQLPQLDEQQRMIGVMQLVASASFRRDGHAGVAIFGNDHGFHALPLQLYAFSDGMVVVGASQRLSAAIGARLIRIGELGIDEVVARLTPFITRDGEMGILTSAPFLIRVPELLVAIGAAPSIDAVELTLEGEGGEPLTLRPEPMTIDDANRLLRGPPDLPTPLYRSDPDSFFWLRYLPEAHTLYLKYNAVRTTSPDGRTLERFVAEVEGVLATERVERVVVDLRHNGGGDNTTFGPMLELLVSPEVDRPGRLFVLIGRRTFSAAGNVVTRLEQRTGATFVGEPTGASPNQFGDSDPIRLPHAGLEVYVPTRYWEFSTPDDPRLTHEPDLRIDLASTDFFAGRDPVLEAVLALE